MRMDSNTELNMTLCLVLTPVFFDTECDLEIVSEFKCYPRLILSLILGLGLNLKSLMDSFNDSNRMY